MTVKKGDNVLVITGKDKGKTGKVTEVSPKDSKVLVDGINIVTKHQKARKQDEKSQIVKKNAPIESSNVMVVCPVCGKATRVAHKEIDGKKARICKKCSASLDKEFVKATKKGAKKVASAQKSKKTTSEKAE
jgi:large subunit ribosomal protein L24